MTRVLLLAVALFVAPALAQGEKGDPVAGKTKAYTCTGCHGVTGWRNAYPNYHVPRIAGQHYEYVVTALTDYRTGARVHPTMQAQGESLSDADIRDIAAYLSSLTAAK